MGETMYFNVKTDKFLSKNKLKMKFRDAFSLYDIEIRRELTVMLKNAPVSTIILIATSKTEGSELEKWRGVYFRALRWEKDLNV